MRKLIAVTGGSGFIGSHVVDALLGAGYGVRVLDTRAPHREDVEWAAVDLLSDDVADALAETEAVFHLAAAADVNDVYAAPVESVALNSLATVRLLEAARRAEAGRVILASTVWVYAASRQPVVDETTCFEPESDRHLYVSTKIAAELFCRDYHTLYQRPYTILRYGIPYGPRMRDNLVIAAFIRRALRGESIRIDGDGRQERFFVYVEDLARAHVLALDPRAEGRTYNLDGSRPVSIREIAETVKELVGDVTVEYGPARPGDLAARVVRCDRAREELGWEPSVSFGEGLGRTLAWYRERLRAEQAVGVG
ncbi:MAG TPA: NAD-dependent epimerase/dehydratase family protein [Nitrolancea sp.]|nr:NAD-dependent epimerase/dehydratase family protein [Nitrolancea sp.]